MEGYKQAEKFDKVIGAILQKEPISKENAMEYLRFSRTLQTSLNIIEKKSIDLLTKEE